MRPTRPALAPLLLGLVLFCSGPLFAKSSTPFHYLAPDAVDLRALLGDPPAPGSPANDQDIQAVLEAQNARTPEQITRLRSEEDLEPVAFATVFGSWFSVDKLPLTFALVQKATEDAHAIAAAAKHSWQRPRPPLQDGAIHPAAVLPETFSYPSFHATRGALWAAILTRLAPDLADQLTARGQQIGQDRVIAGVHFPTDVAAGQKLGGVLAEKLMQVDGFKRDLAAATEELARVRSAAGSEKPRQPQPVPAGAQ